MKQATVPQCSNCCRPFTVTGEGRQQVLRVPLMLECGHSFCSVCVNQLGRVQRATGGITCPQCAKQTSFLAGEEAARQLPSNIFILGLVAANKLNLGGKIPTNGVVSRSLIMKDNPSDIYIDLPSPLPADEFSIECEECKKVAAEVKCTTCKNYLCDKCFEMGHSAMAIFRSHVKIPITLAMSSPIHCSTHKGHMTQFYCRNDSTHLCSECVALDTHKDHQVVSIQDEAEYCRQHLKPMVVSARTILKRMKKSDKTLSELLPKLHNYTEKLIVKIHEDFCALHYSLQLREQTLLEQLVSEADTYVQPILRMRKLLQDNIALATKTINNVQRLLGDSVAIVKSQQIVDTKLKQVLQMDSHLHCDEGEPLSYWVNESAYTEIASIGTVDRVNQYRVLLSNTSSDGTVDEELVTSSDGQSYDSETPLHSSIDNTPKKNSPKTDSPKVKVGVVTQEVGVGGQEVDVAGKQAGIAHPPGLPMPTTNQQQLQHHVRQLLQEVSSSDHLSSSDNDEKRTSAKVSPPHQAYHETQSATHQHDKQDLSLPQQQAMPLDTSVDDDDDVNITPPSATTVIDEDSLDATPRIGGGPAAHSEDDEDITPTYHDTTRYNDYFGVAMATTSTEDAVVTDITAENGDSVTIEQDDLQLLKVIVSHIEDPGEFYIQYSSDHQSLATLMTQLAEHCDDNFTAITFKSAKPGLVCAAKFQEDDMWYRAKILETLQPSNVLVKYTDFGNREWLNCKRLCVLPLEMINQPACCHCCSINDVHPIDGDEWNMSLISRFKGIAMETEFQMKVVSSDDDGCKVVDLMLPPNGPWISSHLLETGMCTNATGVEPSLSTIKIPRHPLPEIGVQLECFVSYAHTPNEFYIQLPNPQLEKLMIELQEYAIGLHPLTTLPLPGAPCLAQFSLDSVWYRAIVTSVEGDNYIVKYVDYGNSELVAMTALQELQPNHCVLPEQAICCNLISACCPADGWGQETLQQFVDMVTNATLLLSVIDIIDGVVAMETLHGTAINDFLSQSGIYQMKNPNPIATNIPAATIPAVGSCCDAVIVNVQSPSNFHVQLIQSQYQLLSAMKAYDKQKVRPKKIEIGRCYLAVDSSNQQVYRVCVVAAIATVSEKYEVYFIDNGCYAQMEVHNLLEMPPSLVSVPSLALNCALDHVMPLTEEWSEECLEFFSRLFFGKRITITIKDIPDEQEDPVLVDMSVALPGAGRTEDVGALLITNQFGKLATPLILSYKPATPPSDGQVTVIHINDHGVVCCQANSSATTLQKVMDLLQTIAKKGTRPPRLVVGQPCAAIFSEDNLWYRAKVISVAIRTAYVNFVDYGNNEDVLLENIYPIKSQDGDVIDVPIQCLDVQLQGLEKFDWSEEILSYMDSLILDKSCQLHVKGCQDGLLTGTFSTEECRDVAGKIIEYINSTPPALLDISNNSATSGATTNASSSVATPPQDHVSSPPACKRLPPGLLNNITSSSQFPDHVIQPPRYPVDHMISKLASLPNPTTNDNHDDEVD